MRPRRQIHVDGAADHRRHVEVGDGEALAEEIGPAGERAVEHAERRLQHLERLGELLAVAVLGRQAHGVQRPDVDAAVDLLHRPQAPFPALRLALECGRIERAGGVLLGEIERDRQRLPQHEAVVVDRRQAAVGIEREIIGAARAGGADLDRDVLVGKPELLGHPDGAEGAGAGDAVDAQHRRRLRGLGRTTSAQ
jgi:hypothetical protein